MKNNLKLTPVIESELKTSSHKFKARRFYKRKQRLMKRLHIKRVKSKYLHAVATPQQKMPYHYFSTNKTYIQRNHQYMNIKPYTQS